MAQTITYSIILSIQQRLAYNQPTTDVNGNPVYQFVTVVTDVKTQGSDGSVRDVQLSTPYGGTQATPYTPQQIYTIMKSAQAGTDLAAELKNAYSEATATVVS